MKKLTEETFQEILNLYFNERLSLVTLGKMYGISNTALQERMKRRGISRRTREEASRRYYPNHNYFNQIDTEEKAYTLGFLYADGYVNESKGTVSLSLQEKDKYILEKINSFIQDRPLHFLKYENTEKMKRSNMYRLMICSKQIVADLKKHGCYQAKTYTLAFPTTVPATLMNHFIRGWIDGDGCISKSLTLPNVSFIGCELFIQSLKDFIKDKFDIHVTTFKSEKFDSRLSSGIINGGKQVRKFLDWIYKDATIYLERKHSKYLALIEKYNEFSKVRKCDVKDCNNKHYGHGCCEYHYNRTIRRDNVKNDRTRSV